MPHNNKKLRVLPWEWAVLIGVAILFCVFGAYTGYLENAWVAGFSRQISFERLVAIFTDTASPVARFIYELNPNDARGEPARWFWSCAFGVATAVYSSLLLRRAFSPLIALVGGLLVVQCTWAGVGSLWPQSYVGPLFAAFLYYLLDGKKVLPLVACLLLSAAFYLPLFIAEVIILACWFAVELYREVNRPSLVAPTLNAPPVVATKTWGLITGAIMIGVLLNVWWYDSANGDYLPSNWSVDNGAAGAWLSGWLPSLTATLGLGVSTIFSSVLLVGAVLVATLTFEYLGKLGWLLLATLVSTALVPIICSWLPGMEYVGHLGGLFVWWVFAPLLVVTTLGAAARYVSKPWATITAVIVLLLWSVTYAWAT